MEAAMKKGLSVDKTRTYILFKGIIQIAALVFVLCILLVGGIVYNDGAVNIKMNFFVMMNALFYGGTIGYNLYGTVVWIQVPTYVTVLYLAAAIAIVGCIVMFVVCNVIKKKDSKICGYVQLGLSAVLILAYFMYMLGGFFTCNNYKGQPMRFYELYEVSILLLAAGLLLLLFGLVQLKCDVQTVEGIKKYFIFYVMLAIPTLCILVFSVYPIFIQIILSFKNYNLASGIWGSAWSGLENFKVLFTDAVMLGVVWRTIYLSVLRLLAGIFPSVIFALILYHITSNKLRSVVQTIVYIPHFFSWVVIYAVMASFFKPEGIINNLIFNVFDGEKIDFLSRRDLFYPNMILTSIWKEVGWGTILYMASLMGIDKTLYDAAAIDGAGVWKKMLYITLPGIVPILMFQIIMSVGNLLKGAGGEQILIFATSSVKENEALVIDTWLYWYGLKELKYGLASALSFVQSVIGFGMVIGAHQLSKKTVGIGAW